MSAETFAERVEYYCDNDAYGYDQTYRWGQYGDFDCSSLMYQCGYDIGLPLTHEGYRYTGSMVADFSAIGATILDGVQTCDSLQRGDILLNVVNHTVAYLGDGMVGGARINEKGTATGGQPGDQTKNEICVHSFYSYPWDYVIRLPRTDEGDGYYGVLECDGYFGELSIRRTQTIFGCWVDGEVWHQWPENAAHLLACTSGWSYDYSLAGSPVIRALQNWLGVEADGLAGADTVRALERRFGYEADGVLDCPSMTVAALQRWLNEQL